LPWPSSTGRTSYELRRRSATVGGSRGTWRNGTSIAAGLPTVERVEVLPFHRLGAPRYAALGLPFPLTGTPVPGPELIDRVRGQVRDRGLTVY
jgi:hypothetical protein